MALFKNAIQEHIISEAEKAVLQQRPAGSQLELGTQEYVCFALTGIFVMGGKQQTRFDHLPFSELEHRQTRYPTFGLIGFDQFGIVKFGTMQPTWAWQQQMEESLRKYIETYGIGIDMYSLSYAQQFLQCIPLPTVNDLTTSSQWKPFIKEFICALHCFTDEDSEYMVTEKEADTAGDDVDNTVTVYIPSTMQDTLLVGIFNHFVSNIPEVDFGVSIPETMNQIAVLREVELQSGNGNASLNVSREERVLARQFMRPRTPPQCVFNNIHDTTKPMLRQACVVYFRWTHKCIPGSPGGTIHWAWYTTSTNDEDSSPPLDD